MLDLQNSENTLLDNIWYFLTSLGKCDMQTVKKYKKKNYKDVA